MSDTIKCTRCSSERIAKIQVINKDCFYATLPNSNKKYEGYNPLDMGLGDSPDDLFLEYCLECGQIQEDFPLKPCKLETITEPPKRGKYYSDYVDFRKD